MEYLIGRVSIKKSMKKCNIPVQYNVEKGGLFVSQSKHKIPVLK